ncbi:NAD(P)-dependent oxidoreductase [Desertifilum sp. FACHB-1129]|uniref:3-beta hydroxysteroid dehydrogenase n=1 Tax=Desertifilum tharense IPPAS B-1220 TaxID=1781255 RepID=A0A1E5QKD3_9CYAN|nr:MULTISPECIES: NAD(P)-dependent oxidoreductase [Desertifilum]MDA0209778.1 NAD(P)-dependent oxidoreductase [Cyanobacteria bacterium FC1]MBD2310731.1 NAD(P)-dependent oxidoreductase [Desertifilum sp. FACHB-1129]MBD2320768.1 NAD(P)-dependent oxidoreductase [Desertifilum sp. FACHB-866]MBD2330896.1 NAD(P)-dependent oxidoreductase [Desertifilum sp. FACHB-868]OEJ75149.1 3-beta hydroxysteroid dehydrogenase [Desertifilum tharense IPPAS B-1220]
MTIKTLVTGGTGFLGKQLALRLHSLDYGVTVLGRNQKIGKQLESEGIIFLAIDLRDTAAVVAACHNQDYVFHCGALSSPWGKYQDFYDTNVLGTQNIIQGCKVHNIQRLIYVSTSSVYFDFCHHLNIPETLPLPNPVNAYAKTKQLAEREINQAYQQGLPAISIRPRGIFGPGDTAILPRLIRANRRVGIPLINQGQAYIDITYIDNVVDALLLCQKAPDFLLGRTFNITNGEPLSVFELLKKLSDKLNYSLKLKPISYQTIDRISAVMEFIANTLLLGQEPILTRYTVGLLAFSQTLDITAATTELGYQPRISIDQGLEKFAQWWKQQHPTSKS